MSPTGFRPSSPKKLFEMPPRATNPTSPRLLQTRAEVPPDPTSPDDRDSHLFDDSPRLPSTVYCLPPVQPHPMLPSRDGRAEERVQLQLVDVVDDLREDVRRLLEPGDGNGIQRIHVRVIHGVVDDVKARCVLVDLAQFSAGTSFGRE